MGRAGGSTGDGLSGLESIYIMAGQLGELMTEEFVCLSECKRSHTLLLWVIGILFVILGSLSLAVGYSVKESSQAEDRTAIVESRLEVLKNDHQKSVDYLTQTLNDMKTDIKEIRRNTDDLRIKVK
jgi:hypothetical protein